MERAEFRELFEAATGLTVAHYARPRGSGSRGAIWVVRAGGRTFAAGSVPSTRSAPLAHAARQLSAAAGRFGGATIPLVIVPHMGPAGSRVCRECGVAFLDRCGNAWIDVPGLRVRLEGRRNRFPARGRPASAFAPKSSRVARVLLLHPARWRLQRDLAERTGLGPGFVSRIVRRLEEDALVERNRAGAVRPADPDLLFDAWLGDHDLRRLPGVSGRLVSGTRDRIVEVVTRALDRRCEHAWTGGAAADLLTGRTPRFPATLYVSADPSPELVDAIGLVVAAEPADLRLVVPRDEGVFEGATRVGGARSVSPVQALLDAVAAREVAPGEVPGLRRTLLSGRWPGAPAPPI